MFKTLFSSIKQIFSTNKNPVDIPHAESDLDREINALYAIVVEVIGSDRLVLQAGKMDALRYLRSENHGERLLALRRILEENPTLNSVPSTKKAIQDEIVRLSELMADIITRRQIEDKIDRKVTEKLEKDHQEYVKDIKLQILREEKAEDESPHGINMRWV